MPIERLMAHAPRTKAVGRDIIGMRGTCIGCTNCKGLCLALIEMTSLPDAVLKQGTPQ